MGATLVLPVKAEFFHAIKSGAKTEEFRLQNSYWAKRLEGRTFDQVVITWGYPSRLDSDKRIVLPWRGMRKVTIQHAFFGPAPVAVYAIDVSSTPADW